MKRFAILAMGTIFMAGYLCPVRGQSTHPVTQPTAPALEVNEWAIFVVDAADNNMNEDGTVQSTLPSWVSSRRQAAKAIGRPYPVGVIRLIGSTDTKVDVKIEKAAGTFLASWPKAVTRSNQLLWRDLSVASDIGSHSLEKVGAATWFERLRRSDSDFLSISSTSTERFLLYDIEMPYKCELEAKTSKDGSVQLNNTGKVLLQDLTLYRTDHGKLMDATVGDMPVSDRATPTTATSASATQGSKAAALKFPATVPVTSRTAQLNAAPTTQPIEAASKWKAILSGHGVLSSDADLAVEIIAQYACGARSLTAVYRLDEAEFDRLVPLEVVPEPKKISRIALVIIRNLDPTAPNEIDDLIKQLGDPVWSKRQAAYDALKALGTSATSRLQAATKNNDVEIAWRAESLLAAKGVQR